MRKITFIAGSLTLLAATSMGCGGEPEAIDSVVDSTIDSAEDELIGGTVAVSNIFGGVVNLNGCTAAKVNQHVFLTAAHCAFDMQTKALHRGYRVGETVRVSNAVVPSVNNTIETQVVSTFVHPGWLELARTCGSACDAPAVRAPDLAFVRIVADTTRIPVMRVDQGTVRVGDSVTVVGYGCEEGLDRESTGPQRLKYGSTRVVSKDVLHYPLQVTRDLIDRYNLLTQGKDANPSAPSLCYGDSGGPLLRAQNGTWGVVGVNSFYSFRSGKDVSYVNWHARLKDESAFLYYPQGIDVCRAHPRGCQAAIGGEY